jgi:AcrR family transcriptional regulator
MGAERVPAHGSEIHNMTLGASALQVHLTMFGHPVFSGISDVTAGLVTHGISSMLHTVATDNLIFNWTPAYIKCEQIKITSWVRLQMNKQPARKKRIRNPELTRAKLLQAAVDLVADKGAEALSLKEVAQRAEVSRSVTYLHFKDRDHLLRETKQWITDQLQRGVTRFDETTPLYERTLHTVGLVLENPEVSRAMMVDALTKGELNNKHPLYRLVMERLRYLQKNGKLARDCDLEVRTYIHLGSIAATLLFEKQNEGEDMEKLAARFTREWTGILQSSMEIK